MDQQSKINLNFVEPQIFQTGEKQIVSMLERKPGRDSGSFKNFNTKFNHLLPNNNKKNYYKTPPTSPSNSPSKLFEKKINEISQKQVGPEKEIEINKAIVEYKQELNKLADDKDEDDEYAGDEDDKDEERDTNERSSTITTPTSTKSSTIHGPSYSIDDKTKKSTHSRLKNEKTATPYYNIIDKNLFNKNKNVKLVSMGSFGGMEYNKSNTLYLCKGIRIDYNGRNINCQQTYSTNGTTSLKNHLLKDNCSSCIEYRKKIGYEHPKPDNNNQMSMDFYCDEEEDEDEELKSLKFDDIPLSYDNCMEKLALTISFGNLPENFVNLPLIQELYKLCGFPKPTIAKVSGAMERLYPKVQTGIMRLINPNNSSISLVHDTTTINKRHIIAVGSRSCDTNFEIKNIVLRVNEMNEKHDRLNFSKRIAKTMVDFAIPKVVSISSDAAAAALGCSTSIGAEYKNFINEIRKYHEVADVIPETIVIDSKSIPCGAHSCNTFAKAFCSDKEFHISGSKDFGVKMKNLNRYTTGEERYQFSKMFSTIKKFFLPIEKETKLKFEAFQNYLQKFMDLAVFLQNELLKQSSTNAKTKPIRYYPPSLNIPLHCTTRFSTRYFTISAINQVLSGIPVSYLVEENIFTTHEEFNEFKSIGKDFEEILKLFDSAIHVLSSSTELISRIPDIYNQLISMIEGFMINNPDHIFIPNLNYTLIKIYKYYSIALNSQSIRLCTLLDERFKDRKLIEYGIDPQPDIITLEQLYLKKSKEINYEPLTFSSVFKSNPFSTPQPLASIRMVSKKSKNEEIEKFLNDSTIDYDVCPLSHWRANKGNYKVLTYLAMDYFSCSPSSIPVEQTFSGVKLIFNDRRNRLSIDKINMFQTLKEWIKCHPKVVFSSINSRSLESSDSFFSNKKRKF